MGLMVGQSDEADLVEDGNGERVQDDTKIFWILKAWICENRVNFFVSLCPVWIFGLIHHDHSVMWCWWATYLMVSFANKWNKLMDQCGRNLKCKNNPQSSAVPNNFVLFCKSANKFVSILFHQWWHHTRYAVFILTSLWNQIGRLWDQSVLTRYSC